MRIWSNDPNFVFYLVNYKKEDLMETANAAQGITDKLKKLNINKFQETFTNAQAMINYAKAL